MSIAAMNWAWQLRLKPNIKIVLLAIADAADDAGFCWPSIKTIAKKTNLETRSVQRILQKLKTDNLIQVQQRFRNDHSQTSNGYCLAINTGGDKLSPPDQVKCRPGMTPAPPPDDANVTQTTSEHINESKPLQPDIESLGSSGCNLVFPKQLTQKEIEIASQKLAALPISQAQELLDELAGRLSTNSIRSNPLSYLRSLIVCAETGTFTPEVGVRVALAREKELEALKHANLPLEIARNSTNPSEQIEKLRQVLSSNKTNNKLVRRNKNS